MWTNRSSRRTHPRSGGTAGTVIRPPGVGSAQAGPADGPSQVEMATLEEMLDALESMDLDRPWAVVADDVLPMLRRRRPLPHGTPEPITRSWPPGIETTFGLDLGPVIAYIGQWGLDCWGITEDELASRAVANVRERCGARRTFALVRETIDGVPVSVFQSRDGWASALLLIPDELTRVFGQAPSLILTPMRDVLIRMPIDADRDLADWLLHEFTSIDPNGLDVPVLALVDGELGFVPRAARERRIRKGCRSH